jgi:hypothetical protein
VLWYRSTTLLFLIEFMNGRLLLALLGATAVLVIGVAAVSYLFSFSQPATTAASDCESPNPRPGWSYFITYFVSNGTLVSLTGAPPPIPEFNNLTVGESILNITNQSAAIHLMYCDALQGHLSYWHLNLETMTVVRS